MFFNAEGKPTTVSLFRFLLDVGDLKSCVRIKIQNQIKKFGCTLAHFLRRKKCHHTTTLVIILCRILLRTEW
jgi:hypothetical protein